MKKHTTALLLGVCLLLFISGALADAEQFCDPIPLGVLIADEQHNYGEEYLDCILFKDTPLGEYCLLLTAGNIHGYILDGGTWTVWSQVSPMQLGQDAQLYFRRHAAGAAPGIQGAAGLRYPDDRGVDLISLNPMVSGKLSAMMQFHWNGEDFRLVGWQSAASHQFVIWEDGLWVFVDRTTGERAGTAKLDRLAEFGLMARMEDLPLTLADARKMETVTRDAAEALFPGWTLGFYEEYNLGHMAAAGYYRVDNGMLTIRRVSLRSDAGGVAKRTETVPIPLSEALLVRLQTQDASELLDVSGYGNTFLTDAAFNQVLLPIQGTVLQSDLQTHGLLLLTEEETGVRRLHFAQPDGGGYAVRSSQPLPEGSTLDLYHYGEDEIGLEWDAQNRQCSAVYTADGSWMPVAVIQHGLTDDSYAAAYCGIRQDELRLGTDGLFVGTHPWHDLFTFDVTKLPRSTEDAVASLDREGWAVVSNPDPKDRLHLRTQPDKNADSLGKFYNHTPVQVLEQQNGWARVRIGTDGRLEGWMMTRYLAFGTAMDAVVSASPELILREGYENSPLFASPDRKETTGVTYGRDTWIAGVIGDDLYILLDAQGNTGYLPQRWFFAGNG